MTVTQTVAAKLPSAPAKPLPSGATDMHAHVFGPLDEFPTGPSTYPIPLADPGVYETMLARAGLSRGVLIQPAPHGHDTRALEAALKRFGGRVRGVAVADADTSDATFARLHVAGVRGLRFIEMRDPKSGQRYAGSVGIDALTRLGPRMREMGWHAQVWAHAADAAQIVDAAKAAGVKLVFDHMGQFDVAEGTDGAPFRTLVDRVRAGEAFVKLTLCRVSKAPPDYADVRKFHDALLAAAPGQLLWGSDWPFVRMGNASPDVGHLLDLCRDWVGDEALFRRILVDNPAQLFDFEDK